MLPVSVQEGESLLSLTQEVDNTCQENSNHLLGVPWGIKPAAGHTLSHFWAAPSGLQTSFRVGRIFYIRHLRPQIYKSLQIVEFPPREKEKLNSPPSGNSQHGILVSHIKKHNSKTQVPVHCVCSSELKATQNLYPQTHV